MYYAVKKSGIINPEWHLIAFRTMGERNEMVSRCDGYRICKAKDARRHDRFEHVRQHPHKAYDQYGHFHGFVMFGESRPGRLTCIWRLD